MCASGGLWFSGFGGWELLFQRGEGPSLAGLFPVCAAGAIAAVSSGSCLVLMRGRWWPAGLAEGWDLFPALPQALLL